MEENAKIYSPPELPSHKGRNFFMLLLLVVGLLVGFELSTEQGQEQGQEDVPPDGIEVVKDAVPDPVVKKHPLAGQVKVTSNPAGASLFVNGVLIGATPITLLEVKPGAYGLRMEKAGHAPSFVRIQVADRPLHIQEMLETIATGSLDVDVEPRGAEVLIDGVMVGLTPLKLTKVEAGLHEMVIRKTNFEPYMARIEIQSGKNLPYTDFSLKDKILAMLQSQVKTEPQRIAHYIDLAHYQFVNRKFDEAVEVYLRAREIAEQPLTFPPGYGEDEQANDQRLRNRDRTRLKKEITKHKRWSGKYTEVFRAKLERAEEIYSHKNLDSWAWVEMAARNHIRAAQYENAERLLLGHLSKAPNSPNLNSCLLELLKVRLKMRNVSSAGETFSQLYDGAQDRLGLMLEVAQAIMSHKERIPPDNGREELLKMAEKACQWVLKNAKLKGTKGDSANELGRILMAQQKASEAVSYFETSIALATSEKIKEDRMLRKAEALRLAGKLDRAQKVLKGLFKSERAEIRQRAKAGLILVRMARP